MDVGAMILTGIDRGSVRVAAAALSAPPTGGALLLDSWDEIVDCSVFAPAGELRVWAFEFDAAEGLPPLSPSGPGHYRVRVHARGRDVATAEVLLEGEGPTEDYLIWCWRAEPSPERIIRQTDKRGAEAREYWQALRDGKIHAGSWILPDEETDSA